MITKVQKWGNSQGLRLSRELLSNAHIHVGDEVDVAVKDGMITVKPVSKIRGKYRLSDLVKKIPKGFRQTEVDWGPPRGKEVW